MLLPLLPLLLVLVPQFESTENISCQRGRWLCQEEYRRVNEPPPEQSHCNLTRLVQCNGSDTFKEIVHSADEQALLGIHCSWIKRDYGIYQMSPRYRCPWEPSYNRTMHPAAAWCPWSFWTEWLFVCRDRAASMTRTRIETNIPDNATGALLSTRRRECRCPHSPGECPTGYSTELRWLPVEKQSSMTGLCSWCTWGQWTSDCTCSLTTLPRARYRACACSNGTLLKPRQFTVINPKFSLLYDNLPCFGLSRDFDTCSECNRPSEPEPEYPNDLTNGFRPPDSDSSSKTGGRTLVTILALPILTILLVIYYVKKCCNRRPSNPVEPVAAHLVAISAAASESQQPPPSPPLLPPPSQPRDESAPPPSYQEAIRYPL